MARATALAGNGDLVEIEYARLRGARGVELEIAVDGARLDRGDADLGADFLAQAIGNGADCELGAGVDGAAGREDLDAGHRTQVDDVAAFLSRGKRQCGGDAVERALDVDVDHRVPLVGVDLGHRADRHDAGIVDQHVEPAEIADDGIDNRLDLFLVDHIELDRRGLLRRPC
jgi:hypothetical protein